MEPFQFLEATPGQGIVELFLKRGGSGGAPGAVLKLLDLLQAGGNLRGESAGGSPKVIFFESLAFCRCHGLMIHNLASSVMNHNHCV
jgi:hypothetical protein